MLCTWAGACVAASSVTGSGVCICCLLCTVLLSTLLALKWRQRAGAAALQRTCTAVTDALAASAAGADCRHTTGHTLVDGSNLFWRMVGACGGCCRGLRAWCFVHCLGFGASAMCCMQSAAVGARQQSALKASDALLVKVAVLPLAFTKLKHIHCVASACCLAIWAGIGQSVAALQNKIHGELGAPATLHSCGRAGVEAGVWLRLRLSPG